MASFSVGSVEGVPFTACSSGSDIIILASNFSRVQQISLNGPVKCLDCSTDVGKIAASYGNQLVIFEPVPVQQNYRWSQTSLIQLEEPITNISFNLEGSRLVGGGASLHLWEFEAASKSWRRIWNCKMANDLTYLRYSPDGTLFCSASKFDRMIKIWYESTKNRFSFIYISHPMPITSLEWRRTSKYTPRGAVANVLLTSCNDNIARIWVQTLQNLVPGLHFHLAGVIEEESMSAGNFVVHWIQNKELDITRSIESLLHDMLLRILKGESCSSSENDIDLDDTLTAESSKKLRHKLCRKMNKKRALAASGRRDLIEQQPPSIDNGDISLSNRNSGRSSPVEEFDKAIESLLKKWQLSSDLLFSINKSDGSLTLWQIKYLDGEDIGVFRQVEIEEFLHLQSALPHYEATTMSLDIIPYSPSAFLDIKRAYLAVTNSGLGSDINDAEILSIATNKPATESEPSISIVTQHMSGILGLWKFNFDVAYPKVQSVDLVARITGLPINPAWLLDGTLAIDFKDDSLLTYWIPEQNKAISFRYFYRASQLATDINLLPQYHLKLLIELLAFGKLQKVKAILNHLVNCLVSLQSNHEKQAHHDSSTSVAPWAHRSRTLSIVAQSTGSFSDSFDIENPSSTIQQQVVEEIELDYIEVTSIKPLSLYLLIDADTKKDSHEHKSTEREFSLDYDSMVQPKSYVDETLDQILGQSTINKLNEQKEFKKLTSDASLTNFNPQKAKLLTQVLTHTHLPGLSNVEQMHLLAVADAVALFDATPDDLNDMQDDDGSTMMSTNIAIDSLDDRGLRFLTAMRQHVYLTRCLPMSQRNELKAAGIGENNIVWAFHSESQEELISLIPCVQRNKPEWSELREFGVGWWLKKLEVLRKLIEKVAQSAYQAKQDPLDAALFYLAMKKKTLVCALLRRVNCDKRLLKLFEQDFNDPVNRKKALKNAYALLGLHRFEHAAAFFILAGSIWDAVEVCINNLNDIQLAIVLIRLHDASDADSNLNRLLFSEILGSTSNSPDVEHNYDPSRAHQDPFLRSLAFWKLGDYLSSVHTLLENYPKEEESSQLKRRPSFTNGNMSVSASLFNFYLFLKDQPLVLKHKQQFTEPLDEKYSDEAITAKEHRLVFSAAGAYLEAGCPLLALEVLCSEDHLNMSRAQRMKFIACLHILMHELNTLASSSRVPAGSSSPKFKRQFFEWLKNSMEALNKICSYSGSIQQQSQETTETTAGAIEQDVAIEKVEAQASKDVGVAVEERDKAKDEEEDGDDEDDDDDDDDGDGDKVGSKREISTNWLRTNEPILRAMLTYCNLHSATENSLTTIRLEFLELLERLIQ